MEEMNAENIKQLAEQTLQNLKGRPEAEERAMSIKAIRRWCDMVLFLCKRKAISDKTISELKMLAGKLCASPQFQAAGNILIEIFREEGINLLS